MIRILFLADTASALSARGLILAGHLRSRGWEADGMAVGAASSPACQEGFDRVLEAPASALQMATPLRAIVRRGGYDVAHLLSPRGSVVARLALRGFPHLRTIYDARGPELEELGQRWAACWTDHLVAPDYATYARFSARRLMPPGRCHLILPPTPERDVGTYLASWDALYPLALDLTEAARPRRSHAPPRTWSPWLRLAPERRRMPRAIS